MAGMLFEILFIRHAETKYNYENRIQGSLDSALSNRGQQQALLTGQMLNKHYNNIDSWYVSPQGRARQTSKIIRESMPGINLPQEQVHNQIREIECGEWEGLLHDDLDQMQLQKIRHSANIAYPGGESLWDLMQRGKVFLSDWKKGIPVHNDTHRSVIISHGNMIGALSAVFLDLPPEMALRSLIHNCAINRILARNRSFYFRMAGINIQNHLHENNGLPAL